ncbi:MAG TPA: monovalent cation:proton antiporter-2 (CPA2) family protein [Caulobacterales bacterium]|nr:monovalent cation:proton antiporter-2 (CPA2) family protein [Caulobacterales bacterium]
MNQDSFLFEAFVFLAAAIVSVPIAKRLGLGSVLGYLLAGVLIGPFGLKFLGDPEALMHASEFGVVIMLFLIGLELNPAMLWRMRSAIVGLGGAQVLASGGALALAAMGAGLDWRVAVAVGFTLSLSSTAIVMQSLRERGLAQTDAGRGAFSVLLFQDIAVIPMLALFPLLAAAPLAPAGAHATGVAALPAWAQTLAVFGAVAAVVVAGRVLVRPLFRYIARTNLRELFTATALAIVVGVALLMQSVGLSPALGAFVAGVVLADSEYRHELESDIEPFRALLLGLFFISVGAGVDFGLILAQPLMIFTIVAALIAIKAAALFAVARLFGRSAPDAAMIALALAQGGEFAFVLFNFAAQGRVIPEGTAALLVAAVALSMALTPLLMIAAERAPRLFARAEERAAPERLEHETPDVLIAGYGRFGQIVSRLVSINGFAISILDHNADQVELVRGFGAKANYGDASRADMLRVAGADDAKLLVVAVDDQGKALEIVETARRHFPHLKILARAYDRRHAYEMIKREVDGWERETFEGGLRLGAKALRALGFRAHQAERAAGLFRRHDERQLAEMYEHWASDDRDAFRAATVARQGMIEDALKRDLAEHVHRAPDDAWDTESLDEENARLQGGG